jgi:hypothetical protein
MLEQVGRTTEGGGLMNPLATAGLVLMAIAQLIMASATLSVPAEEIHFRALQQFCQEEQKRAPGADPRVYFACVAEYGPAREGRR